jgi:hypothetical protein
MVKYGSNKMQVVTEICRDEKLTACDMREEEEWQKQRGKKEGKK